jgi:hypothetical protein
MGAPLPELRGRTLTEMAVPADRAAPYLAALQRVFAMGQAQEHYHSLATPAGVVQLYTRLVPELRDGQVETVLALPAILPSCCRPKPRRCLTKTSQFHRRSRWPPTAWSRS